MKQFLIQRLVMALLEMFDADELREYLDDMIDRVENKYQNESSGKAYAVMALSNTVRTVLSIPDDIGGDKD